MKKKIKKGFNVTLAMTLAATMLAGCGGSKNTAPAAQEAEYSSDPSAEYAPSPSSDPSLKVASSGEKSAQKSTKNAQSDMSAGNYEEAATEGEEYMYYPPENTETYEKPDENGATLVSVNPLSTFAMDVDTASYSNVRRMIEDGYSREDIPTSAVRPEEFINYFSYDLNSPNKGEAFGITTELADCPWNKDHKIMFVGLKTSDMNSEELPEGNLVFLIDVSGSMSSDDKLPLLKKSLNELVDNYTGEGTISIVTYSGEEKVLLEGENLSEKKKIKKAINSLSASGSTNGESGMKKAYEIAAENYIDGGVNRVIMATDGDLNVGISDPDELENFIKTKKDTGVFLSVLGFGTGNFKDASMQRLADCGNGNYSYIDSMMEAKKVLVDEMTSTMVTVAKDAKIQVEFNPNKVNSYRLIGYENRQMDAADFNDDQKDGGEVGAGHSVIALYEITTADSEKAVNLKYQNNEEKEYGNEYATVNVRYKEPEADESKLSSYTVTDEDAKEKMSDNMKFAQIVAEFSLILSDSDYKKDASYKHITDTYSEIGSKDEYKDEFIQLVRMVEKRDL
ncbi:VWA domain-containing protein [Butyrivibrio sp. XB500-5]|uniref:vWA domain-containing protein n=1 Tax=Butyrivibrio sp. XB500-5 TaxID=2364880 RepID=UPI000EA88637|nr:VWA domain-containing protein [Butyrivibrio sp. XB500-5]RKM58529.1 VWA domain-containing protein [Butyrivibrio sp. XB500-5]